MLTKAGTGEGMGDPRFLGTFCVTLKVTGVVTVLRTAANTVRLPADTQLCGIWTITESDMGKPLPLLSKVAVAPPKYVMSTVKDDIEVDAGMFPLNP